MLDTKKIFSTVFKARESEVQAPELQALFPEGEKALWKVRGLSGFELGIIRETKRYEDIKDAILGFYNAKSESSLKDAITLMAKPPEVVEDVMKRQKALVLCSIEPKCDELLAAKICKHFGRLFYTLTDEIYALTGQGDILEG